MEDIVRKCELEALAVVTQSNAEEVAFFTDRDTDVDIFCALAAASLDTATKVTNKMNHGSVLELVVLGETGYTIMSPVADKYILIGAGKDFFSLGKTILILREKVKEIPLTLTDKIPTTTKRKACSHFCQNNELYCCVCSGIESEMCDICQTSIQQKQAEQKRILEEALEKAKSLDMVEGEPNDGTNPDANPKSDSVTLPDEGQALLNKVMTKIQTIEKNRPSEKNSPVKAIKKKNKRTNYHKPLKKPVASAKRSKTGKKVSSNKGPSTKKQSNKRRQNTRQKKR